MTQKNNEEQACACHGCALTLELVKHMTVQNQAMAEQNRLMTKIIDQNGALIDLFVSEEDAEKVDDPNRSLD